MSQLVLSYKDLVTRMEDCEQLDQLNMLLNKPPRREWLKKNRFANGNLYLPIDKVELLLTTIFQEWHLEVKQVLVVANSVAAVVRLYYRSPIDGKMLWHDGAGAAPIQQDSGSDSSDVSAVKKDGAKMAVPMAVSYAMKDAAGRIGKIFGGDLNKDDAVGFVPMYYKVETLPTNGESPAEEEVIEIPIGSEEEEITTQF